MFNIGSELAVLIEEKTINYSPLTANGIIVAECGCTGNCGQSCAGGFESGCSGDCGRSCSGSKS
ncbi:MAG: hypothetical protein HQK65_21585 [Desulfamplus sp.]|nr:hypothetical protein [Desulfamplus sp.]